MTAAVPLLATALALALLALGLAAILDTDTDRPRTKRTTPMSEDLKRHIADAARDIGAPAPSAGHLAQLTSHPLSQRFEELVAKATAAGSSARGVDADAANAEGDDLLRALLVDFVGYCNRAEAAQTKIGRKLSPLAADVRAAIQGVLRKHAQPSRRRDVDVDTGTEGAEASV